MINLECLNTELLYEIFDYLSFTDLFCAFFNLQQRINNAIRSYPASINLSYINERSQIIFHGRFTCRSLIVTNIILDDIPIIFSQLNFSAIRMIKFQYINFNLIQSILEQLPAQQLESIMIKNFEHYDEINNIDRQFWSTIAIAGQHQLQYLHISHRINQWYTDLLVFDMPRLQCIYLKYISVKELLEILRHTPNLYSFIGYITSWNMNDCIFDFNLRKLCHFELEIKNYNSFENLHQFLSIGFYATHFILRFWIDYRNETMLGIIGWQNLIEQCLPYLIYVKIRLVRFTPWLDDNDLHNIFDLSEYWLQRKPQFDIQVH